MSKTKEVVEVVKNVVETAAIIAAAVWAAFVFGYKEWWVPEHVAPHVNLSNKVVVLSQEDESATLQLETQLRNDGTRRAYILGYWFNVYGYRFIHSEPAHFKERLEAFATRSFFPRCPISRHFSQSEPTVEASGRLSGDGWWLEPGESISFQRIVVVAASYDSFEADVDARVSASSGQVRAAWSFGEKGIGQTSELLVDGKWQNFEQKNPRHRELREEYGLTLTHSVAAAPLRSSSHPSSSLACSVRADVADYSSVEVPH